MSELDVERRKLASLIARHSDSRITIRETEDGLGIHNPSRRLMPVILFLLLWLGGWSVGEYFALNEIFRGGGPLGADLFLIFWLTFWTLGGLAAWVFVLWQLFGVEQLFVTAGAVVHEIGLWRFRRRRVYAIDTVSGFELAARPTAADSTNRAITFQAGGETRGFGVGMSEDEAKAALGAIKRHLPAPKKAAEPDEDTVVP